MRKIKFRLWCETLGRMIHATSENENWMVATGFTDRKSDEIYEDDIVRVKDDLYLVKYLYGTFYADKIGGDIGVPLSDIYRECEIVGNRHEDPWLMRRTKP